MFPKKTRIVQYTRSCTVVIWNARTTLADTAFVLINSYTRNRLSSQTVHMTQIEKTVRSTQSVVLVRSPVVVAIQHRVEVKLVIVPARPK